MQLVFFLSVPEVEGELDSISSLCSQITNAFSTVSEDPFSSAPMTKPVTAVAPQSPAFQGMPSLNLDVFAMLVTCAMLLSFRVTVLMSQIALHLFLFAFEIIEF